MTETGPLVKLSSCPLLWTLVSLHCNLQAPFLKGFYADPTTPVSLSTCSGLNGMHDMGHGPQEMVSPCTAHNAAIGIGVAKACELQGCSGKAYFFPKTARVVWWHTGTMQCMPVGHACSADGAQWQDEHRTSTACMPHRSLCMWATERRGCSRRSPFHPTR